MEAIEKMRSAVNITFEDGNKCLIILEGYHNEDTFKRLFIDKYHLAGVKSYDITLSHEEFFFW